MMTSGGGGYVKQKHQKSEWARPTPIVMISNNESLFGYGGENPTKDETSVWSGRMFWFKTKTTPISMWKKMNNEDIHPHAWLQIFQSYDLTDFKLY